MSKQEIDMPQSDNAKARYNRAMQQVPSQEHKQTVSAESLETSFQQALTFIENNDPNAAIPELHNILLQQSDDPAVWFNLGRAYDMAGQLAEAEHAYRQALLANSDSPAIWFALGEIRLKQNAFPEAEFCLRKAHGLKPDSVEILQSLGSALSAQSKTAEAFESCQKILAIKPDCIEAIYNMSFIQLRSGDYLSGFANFEARLAIEKFNIDPRRYRQPRWDGTPLNGRSILIYGEQGMGDVIQFARYIPLVAERGGKVVFELDPPLIPLFESFPGVDRIVPKSKEPPLTDVYVQLLSLPYLFGTSLETVPNQVPYIFTEQSKVEQWRQCLARHGPAYRIGLVWRGNPRNPFDQVRSCPFEEFLPLAAFHGVQFFSLQVGAGADEIADLNASIKLFDHTDQLRDFSETAAFIANLDLVIGADTAVTHLAGSLGKKVWILLPKAYDWRWLAGRDDSPWYPTARLFWQHRQGDWAGVMTRVKTALGECLAGKCNNSGPAEIEIIYDHGTSLKEAGDLVGAEGCFRQIVEQHPELPDPQHSLGVVLQLQGRLQEAIQQYRNAIVLDPGFVKAHYNLAYALLNCGAYQEATDSVQAALQLDPAHADAHWLLGMLLLRSGDFLKGWREYEWRWKAQGFTSVIPELGRPLWDGSPLEGRTLLIHMEQGRGDMIQFIRYAPLASGMGGKVVVCAMPELLTLLTTVEGISQVVDRNGPLPAFDVHIPVQSLALVLGTTLESIPSRTPYLWPDQFKKEEWRQLLAPERRFRIGLAWQGTPGHIDDHNRSCSLDDFLPLFDLKGVAFYSLQIGTGSEQLAECSSADSIADFTSRIRDFSDTAALVANLDLVISVDTAVAHLAGALGKQVWLMLPYVAEWRWLMEREDSPWYPTMRLFRQTSPGDWFELMERIRKKLVSLIEDADSQNQQGIELLKAGFAAEAEQAFYRSAELNPDSAETRCNRGVALDADGRYDEALTSYREALIINPDFVQALYNMGNTYLSLNNPDTARECYLRTVELKPDFVAAYLCLGEIEKQQRVFDQALACYESALSIDPDCADAWQGIAEISQAQEKYEQAIVAYKKVLSLDAGRSNAWNMLGTVFHSLEQLEDAEACYRQALDLLPDSETVLNNLGVVLNAQGRLDDAIAIYRHLLQVDNTYAEGHWNLSVALLTVGEYPEGWREYEWRFRKTNPVVSRDFPQPRWDGSPLLGRTILLHSEQGFGDTIQFVRYIRLMALRGDRVILECQVPALKRLLHSLEGVAEIVVAGERLPPFDCHLPMMSLPLLFGTTLETIPSHIPYLAAEPADVKIWQQRLGPVTAFRVGLVWFAKQSQVLNRKRSCPLTFFSPMWDVQGVEFYTLQIGEGSEQLEGFAGNHGITDLTRDIKDFADTAALIANLDLVITIDTAVAHLAGALGARTWLILPYVAEWRWLCQREDSPWYPTMKLFRQPSPGNWSALMDDVVGALHDCVKGVVDNKIALRPDYPKLRVGLAWSGRQDNPLNRKRSCPFSSLAPLFDLKGITIVNLQLDSAEGLDTKMIDLTGQIRDFEDTAALMAHLDLILSIDTSVAHLAAATGRPTWVLLPHVADWRWLTGRDNSPFWYPGVKLFRQPDFDDWDGVIRKVAERLSKRSGKPMQKLQSRRLGTGIYASDERRRLEQLLEKKLQEVRCNGTSPDAHLDVGAALALLGRNVEAVDAFRHVLELDPEHVTGHLNLAYSLLAIGNYSEGWENLEWRLRRLHTEQLPPWPMLDRKTIGSHPVGTSILVHCEQGYGDTILFSRFLPLLAEVGYRVVVSCQPAMATLVAAVPGVSMVIPHSESLPICDLQVLLLSLPWLFSVTPESLPIGIPYLVPGNQKVDSWNKQIEEKIYSHFF
ncbi:MAG: tetratricopeptide repeat protein [Geobacteraceae bacterium]|nr:tetratricopeptide repeat protein [Geobacteraceae bacterium]NTW79402.1 tetratricopeptide repeat protein [Geobacteraceae bacterium]